MTPTSILPRRLPIERTLLHLLSAKTTVVVYGEQCHEPAKRGLRPLIFIHTIGPQAVDREAKLKAFLASFVAMVVISLIAAVVLTQFA